MQEAEYRNRKEGMETGWTEEERSTGGTADRGEREEGKGKNGRLSSQKRAEADERKQKTSRKARVRCGRKEAEKKGSTGGTAVGAKPGRMKGNKQEAEYEEPGKKAWETRPGRTGKGQRSVSGRVAPGKPL